MEYYPLPTHNTRTGFHYFPDTTHYRESDLNAWLPELQALGASWLTLISPPDRAIPEFFLRGLLSAGIQPVLHFCLPADLPPPTNDLRLLFNLYARWGVHYVVIFDRPNTRLAWSAPAWSQSNLVERFLDSYLPLADAAFQAGLIPVFPPLEPGGDYWDTAFLRAALQGIQRRGFSHLLDRLVIGAYGWTHGRSLNWGAGGPERWPGSRPYHTPTGSEDQVGLRVFDWYLAVATAVTGKPSRILLVGGGARFGEKDQPKGSASLEAAHAQQNLAIAALMAGDQEVSYDTEQLEPVPSEVLSCNFWLLAASKDSPHAPQAWFKSDGSSLPVVGALRQWRSNRAEAWRDMPSPGPVTPCNTIGSANGSASTPSGRLIEHYLLLPVYEWGVSDWHLDVIRPFIKKYRPTIGYSMEEARRAARVTVVGGVQSFPETSIQELRGAGCIVQQISGDGTTIATQLAAL